MAWTRRHTVIGLATSLVLGLATVVVFGVSESHRTGIVDRGAPTEAVVIYDHHTERGRWYTVSYTAQGQARTADLHYPWLIGDLPLGQVLTVHVDPDHPELIATADGYSTPFWTSAPGLLAFFAFWAAFIAIAGHLSARRRPPS